jgi:putative tryptophan/tyrosine transport system substrate-binding protein
MIGRRSFAAGVMAVATAPSVVRAQTPTARPLVAVLAAASRENTAPLMAAFLQDMESYGWVRGRNYEMVERYADGLPGPVPVLAAEMVTLRPAVLLVSSLDALVMARPAIGGVPAVFAAGADPVAAGVAESYRRPGGNITGVSAFVEPGLWGKRLQLLLDLAPHARKIGLLIKSDSPNGIQGGPEFDAAAASLGVTLIRAELQVPADIDAGFDKFVREGVGAVLTVGDTITFNARQRIAALQIAWRLPTMFALAEYVEAGGLISYGNSNASNWRRAAFLVHKVLTGSSPAELPIDVQPRIWLAINLKTAQALGLTLPESILARAEQVVE